MKMEQKVGHAPRTTAIGQSLVAHQGPCIGCDGCQGLCSVLIEMISMPDAVLKDSE